MRKKEAQRDTAETKIRMTLSLDGSGKSDIDTGCGFLNHMLTLFAAHGSFDLSVKCIGDTDVDYHHTAEDIGIVLGSLFADTLGDKKGIVRYGSMLLPMDEALVLCAVDFSGRAHLSYDVPIMAEKVGDFDTELCEEFFAAFVRSSASTLHIKKLDGRNAHHIIEAVFKAAARAISAAVRIDAAMEDRVPSTKGVL